MSDEDLTLDDVLNELLGDRRTGNLDADLNEAGREIWNRRHRNTLLGGIVLAAMRAKNLTWREIQDVTRIPIATAHRWALPPPGESDPE